MQTILALFSWLKTIEEVELFGKYYTVVVKKLVEELVDIFKMKQRGNISST